MRLLRYFAAVAAEGNLTRAAARLFVSQSALTKQVKQLEAQLDVELFIRSRSGMALTEAGSVLADQVPDLLAGWDAALRRTKAAASRAARVLRVGFIASAANEATQQIIGEFTRRRPGWRVDMRQADWSHSTAGLADGEADAALRQARTPAGCSSRVDHVCCRDQHADQVDHVPARREPERRRFDPVTD